MLNIKEYIKDLILSGLTKEEACCEARKELKRIRKSKVNEVVRVNDHAAWFRENCNRFQR